MDKKEFFVMDYKEFNVLVNANILSAKGNYEFIAEEEMANDSDKAYYVKALDPNNDYDKKYTIPDIEGGKLQYQAGSILE